MSLSLKTLFTLGISLLAFSPTFAHKRVGITQIVSHPSLNTIREGIIEVLTQDADEPIEIVFENAQGNTTIATQIAQKFAGMGLDLIIAITTPSAQSVAKTVTNTPIVFSAVSDPLEAKIVASLTKPGKNRTGVMDSPPLKRQLKFMKALLPHMKTLGVPYNPGEANSVAMIRQLKNLAKSERLSIVSIGITKSAEIGVASQAFVGQVDAVFIGTDNTVVSGLEALIKTCLENNLPLFASDPDSVDRGAYAALAYDQKRIGRKTGELALRVLNGESAGDIPLIVPDQISISFNKTTAHHLGLPDSVGGHP